MDEHFYEMFFILASQLPENAHFLLDPLGSRKGREEQA